MASVTAKARCRHCGKGPASRPRGLGWCCYYRPGVREQYPPCSKYGRRGVGIGARGDALPEPTAAAPGTGEKVGVLEQRAELGLQLWHPDDAFVGD